MRVFTASLATETNTFSPIPTGHGAFRDRGYFPAGTYPDHLTLFAGPLWVLREVGPAKGWTVIEGLVAGAQPGGPTSREAYTSLRDELLDDLARALPVDMVCLGLHGAMVAEGCDDCEGDILARVRALVGPDVTVGASLDPHNHLTEAMVANADILVAFKEYPHTDIVDCAREVIALCEAVARGRIRPVAAVVDCAMIVPFHTSREPARGLVDRLRALEGRDGILSVSLTHGFGHGDVADMGTKVLVYADDDRDAAEALAQRLAAEVVGLRDALAVPHPAIDEALDQALALPDWPVILADRADNPGSGAPGDSTFVLRRLIERGIEDAALGPVWDPGAVRIAFEAGIGARLPIRIGGKVGPASGEPLDLDCTVRAVHPDMVMTGLSGSRVPLGDCALVAAAGIDIVLISLRNQAMGRDLFTQLGCDLARKRLVVVKSAQHFYASFAAVARHVLYVGAPGAATPHLATLPYRKIARPKWPLDP